MALAAPYRAAILFYFACGLLRGGGPGTVRMPERLYKGPHSMGVVETA